MRSITFKFKSDVPAKRQGAILARINSWKAVRKAGPLNPEAKHPLARRLSYAYVEDDADIDTLVDRLSKIPDIESASIPAERHLI